MAFIQPWRMETVNRRRLKLFKLAKFRGRTSAGTFYFIYNADVPPPPLHRAELVLKINSRDQKKLFQRTENDFFRGAYVRDRCFELNGTTRVPKSVLRYVVDKVKLFVPI